MGQTPHPDQNATQTPHYVAITALEGSTARPQPVHSPCKVMPRMGCGGGGGSLHLATVGGRGSIAGANATSTALAAVDLLTDETVHLGEDGLRLLL